jgi:hypothetical protein
MARRPLSLPPPRGPSSAGSATPRVEAQGDPAHDLSGLSRTFLPETLGRAILDAARAWRIEPQVALAFTRTTAIALSRAPLSIVPAGAKPRPWLPALELLDLSPDRLTLFHRWGRRIGDLQALPHRPGRLGPKARTRAPSRSLDTAPSCPPSPESFRPVSSWTGRWTASAALLLLSRVLETLYRAPRGQKAPRSPWADLTSRPPPPPHPSPRPAHGSAHWRTLLCSTSRPIRPATPPALSVTAEPAPARVQFSLFDPAQPSRKAGGNHGASPDHGRRARRRGVASRHASLGSLRDGNFQHRGED